MPKYYRRGYRRYRRRYRLYARRPRLPKAVGTSVNNIVKACFTVEQTVIGSILAGDYYVRNYMAWTPFATRMIPGPFTYYMDNWAGIAGLYNSYSFRKMCTIYQQFKVDGMYLNVQITPASDSGCYTIYSTWDRHTNVYDAAKYLTNYPTCWQATIKGNANEQGGRFKTLYPDKGTTMYNTKCVSSSLTEKSTWLPTDSYYNQGTVIAGPDTINTNEFQTQMWRETTNQAAFTPVCFMSVERSTPAPAPDGATVHIKVKMRFYCTFKNPGISRNTYERQRLLLEDNDDLAPTSVNTKQKVKGEVPGDITYKAEKRLAGESTIDIQPPVKAVEREELMDEDDEDDTTQKLL